MKKQDYQLIFSDEFDYEGAPDSQKWTYEVGNHQWPNRELQAYTDRPDNVHVKDGKLRIVARKEQDGEREYTSAKLNSIPRWQYGYIVVSAKFPKGAGSWPAIWMLPEDIRQGVKWPLCGEIDMVEHIGRKEGDLYFSLHSQKNNHTIGTGYTTIKPLPGVCDDFHEYAMEWTPDYIEYFVNGESFAKYSLHDEDDHSIERWPFNKPYYLIMNIAVGGGLGGPVDESKLPYVMEIDYVRVYQKK